jgi:ABC-type multidrug transport system ATPase subunit
MTEPLVRASNLTKHFADFVAVDSVDFTVNPGEVSGS